MTDDELLRHYSAALDEIYRLRAALAYEAQVTDAHHLGYKTFPKSRRPFAEQQAERMRALARGDTPSIYAHTKTKYALREADAPETLTRAQWESR